MLVTLIAVSVIPVVNSHRNIAIAISDPTRGIAVFVLLQQIPHLRRPFTPLSRFYRGRDQKSVQKCSYKTEENKPNARPQRRWNGKNVKLYPQNAAEAHRTVGRRSSNIF